MTISPSFITHKRMRKVLEGTEVAWCRVEGPGSMTREVLKVYTNDPTQDYAKWMVKGWMPDQGGEAWADYGDEYVTSITRGELVQVDGRAPTSAELIEWSQIAMSSKAPGWG